MAKGERVIAEWLNNLLLLIERGGSLIWLILLLSIWMWVLILGRYRFLFVELATHREGVLNRWFDSRWRAGAPRPYLKNRMKSLFASPLQRHLHLISALLSVLPLLGLLGTITGMIKVFDVITMFGVGNARGMATGISEALITTMAGLVTALSGLYFNANLNSVTSRETAAFDARLNRKLSSFHTDQDG